jgi:hypothetical protein
MRSDVAPQYLDALTRFSQDAVDLDSDISEQQEECVT